MIRTALVALVGALALPALALPTLGTGIPAATTVTFTSVDAVKVEDGYLVITGVVEGDAAASSRYAIFDLTSSYGPLAAPNLEACERFALTSMERPGRYRLEVTQGRNSFSPPITSGCRLVRVAP
ncbi:MAG: hypothetical protein QM704_12020 [Anaeromyxobacteraceae bacterium]